MARQDSLEDRVARLEDRIDRMQGTLATKDDIKLLHDRLNNLTTLIVGIGFLNIVAITVAAVIVRLLT